MGNWIRGVLAVLVLIVMAAISGCAEEGSTSDQSEDTTTSAQDAEPEDTGRMSEGEFESFRSEAQRVVEETLQWSNGYETCAKIGQTGDFAGFRDCIDEAWDGFEGAALASYQSSSDTLDEVAKLCRKSLQGYKRATDRLYSGNLAAHDAAKALDFEAISALFTRLPKAAKSYRQATQRALKACKPS